jgi:hypothetical protein
MIRYQTQNGKPRINGPDMYQFQKSRDIKNKPTKIIYHAMLLFFGNQNGKLMIFFFPQIIKFIPVSWIVRLETE